MDDDKDMQIAALKHAVADVAMTAERACARLVEWQPVIDAAKAYTAAPSGDARTALRIYDTLQAAVDALIAIEKARS